MSNVNDIDENSLLENIHKIYFPLEEFQLKSPKICLIRSFAHFFSKEGVPLLSNV